MKPAIVAPGGGGFGGVQIFQHQAGITIGDTDFAFLAHLHDVFAVPYGDPASDLRAAQHAGARRGRGAGGDEGGAFRHAIGLVNFGAGGVAPGIAQPFGQLFPGGQRMAQLRQGQGGCGEQLAKHAGRGGKERGVVAFEQERQHHRIGARRGYQRGGPRSPWVHQPGAQRKGPVERARVQHPVRRVHVIPARNHHLPRPDGAMGMHHGARRAGGAGGEDDIGRAVRVPHGVVRGRQRGHVMQMLRGQHRYIRLGAGHLRVAQNQRGIEDVDLFRGLGRGQLCRCGHRDQPGGD